MKILEIDYDYYALPSEFSCIDEFISYANEHYHSFIKLIKYETENCAFPYFICEDTKEVYVNFSAIKELNGTEATVLCREEYESRLAQVVKKKCIDCVNYTEALEGDNLEGHRSKLTLDGECWGYEKKQ